MFASVLFDESCLLCGRYDSFSGTYALCRRCFSEIIFTVPETPACRVCSRGLISENEICMRCRKEEFSFGSNVSLGNYDGNLKKAIGLYKFRDRRKLARFFALMIYRFLKKNGGTGNILAVPAPCSRKRMKEKGYNHMGLVCRILRRKYSVQVFDGLKRYSGKQLKLLNREGRKKELAGKIYIPAGDVRRSRKMAAGKRVLFIDDIFTTGTTASVCCGVLKKYGAENVDAVTLALD